MGKDEDKLWSQLSLKGTIKLMGCRNGIGQHRRQSLEYSHLRRHRWL